MENRYKKIREDYEFTIGGHKMTMEELSDIFLEKGYSSLTYNAIRKIETNNRNVSEYELQGYREVFNTTADYLLGFTNEPSRNEDEINASNVTGLDGKAIKTLKILKRSEYINILNYLMSDYFLFATFLNNLSLYFYNEYDTPVHFDKDLGIFVESYDGVSESPITTTDGSHFVSIGKKMSENVCGHPAYQTISVPVSILESHALHCIQEILDTWKTKYQRSDV